MSVHVEVDGLVTTVVIDRPEVRDDALDGPTAAALAAAFRVFDDDATRRHRWCDLRVALDGAVRFSAGAGRHGER